MRPITDTSPPSIPRWVRPLRHKRITHALLLALWQIHGHEVSVTTI